MKTIRLSWSLVTASLWVAAASAGLGGCGGSTEVVQSPEPAKVKWGDSDAPVSEAPASEEPKASAEPKAAAPTSAPPPEEQASPNDIDLDAPAPKAAAASPVAAEEEADTEEVGAAPEAPAASADPLAAELQKRRIAKDRKANKGKKPKSKKKAASAAPAEPAGAAYSGSDPCRATSFSVPRVREACAAGGRAAAKRVMKDAIGKATATGQSLKCSSCHSNQRNYALKGDAVAELKRWLDG